jgi:heme oxygenase (mycobilin-producing)
MGHVKYYSMIAREGQGAALHAALDALAEKIRLIAGCDGTELLEDAAKPGRFVFLERWTSVEAHMEGSQQLGKEAFAPLMAVVAQPPESASLTPLS